MSVRDLARSQAAIPAKIPAPAQVSHDATPVKKLAGAAAAISSPKPTVQTANYTAPDRETVEGALSIALEMERQHQLREAGRLRRVLAQKL
jgi:hypothetical protein